ARSAPSDALLSSSFSYSRDLRVVHSFPTRRSSDLSWVVRIANIIQTIPALAMVSMLMFAFGLGVNVVIVTVFLYSLLPIIKNTYTGMTQVDRNALDVGKGMGMTAWQRLHMIELPLAISVIM